MIPYIDIPSLSLGPITLQAFGLTVAAAAIIGLAIAQRRFARYGLDPVLGESMSWWIVIGGFLGAHLFAVLLYFPDELRRDPLLLLRLWEHISSFGGMVGGAIGGAVFLAFRAPPMSARDRWSYLDAAAFAFAIALTIGRIGCAIVHDHPGRVTDFPLGVSLASEKAQSMIRWAHERGHAAGLEALPADLSGLGFHDLGLYELAYLALIVLPIMFWLDRTPRRPGFFVVVFAALYMPVRFGLDFLRVSDVQYAGLTPAQWAAVAALLALPLLWKKMAAWAPIALGLLLLVSACRINPYDPSQRPQVTVTQPASPPAVVIAWRPAGAQFVRVYRGAVVGDGYSPALMWSIVSTAKNSIASGVTYGVLPTNGATTDVPPTALVPGETYTVQVTRQDPKGSGDGFTNTSNRYVGAATFTHAASSSFSVLTVTDWANTP